MRIHQEKQISRKERFHNLDDILETGLRTELLDQRLLSISDYRVAETQYPNSTFVAVLKIHTQNTADIATIVQAVIKSLDVHYFIRSRETLAYADANASEIFLARPEVEFHVGSDLRSPTQYIIGNANTQSLSYTIKPSDSDQIVIVAKNYYSPETQYLEIIESKIRFLEEQI